MAGLEPEREMLVVDPVCGRRLPLEKVAAQQERAGWAYFFCSDGCLRRYQAAPERYASAPAPVS